MQLTDLDKHILEVAAKHPSFNRDVALAELQQMHDYDVVEQFWTIYKKAADRKVTGSSNPFNSSLAYWTGVTSIASKGTFSLEKRRTYARPGFPDIDMDFDHFRRHEIVDYLIVKYGRDNVGNIGTVQRLKTKAAVRRAIKVLDPTNSIRYDEEGREVKLTGPNPNFALENEILKTLPKLMKREDGSFVDTVEQACKQYPDFDRYMRAYPQIKDVASRIENTISGFGQHAAGIVLSPEPLSSICPLHQTTDRSKQKTVATQFAMADVERRGLIKMDILGLKTKTAVAMTLKWIEEGAGKKIDLNAIPLNDPATLSLLNSGKTDGCFQLEEPGMKQTIRLIHIDDIEDLITAVAMYRPGPKDYIPLLADRKAGKLPVDYQVASLKDITGNSYGILAYQEQVMLAFMALSGLSFSDGYKFTKGCAKKKQELIDGYEVKFLKGCINHNIPENVARRIWVDMKKFGGYAFNRAHAASYAEESFRTAYLKAHYPAEFMAARLTVESMDREFDKLDKYEHDCTHNLGFTIMNPDLNKAKMHYRIIDDHTLMRPMLIKGIGTKAAEDIVAHQPYKGSDLLLAFATKVGKAVNSKVMEAMYDAGLWKSTGKSKPQILKDFETIKEDRRKGKGRPNTDLFA